MHLKGANKISSYFYCVYITGKVGELKCSVMLQKEVDGKLVDEACGDAVKDGHAGLCEYEPLFTTYLFHPPSNM